MPEYIIRKVNFDELNTCADVVRRGFNDVAREFGITVENCPTNGAFIDTERLIKDWNHGNLLYGIYCDGDLDGFMELRELESRSYELKKLCVLPEQRHNGCGALMLDFVRSEVIKLGGHKLVLSIIEENGRLKDWYIRQGFTHVGTEKIEHLPFTVGHMEMSLI